MLYCTSVLVLYYEALTAVIKKTKTGALRWKYQQQLGQERCSTDIIRKENFQDIPLPSIQCGEMIATTANGYPRAILEQASIIREDFRESQKMIEIESKQVILLCEGGKRFDSSLYTVQNFFF